MGNHIIDSELFGAAFVPTEAADIFSDANRVQKWFDVEVALAQAQAELGIIPTSAAAEIRRAALAEQIDFAEVGAGIRETAHPLVPALRALEALCAGDAGEYIHYGATTQDIMDTGMMLQLREAWQLIAADVAAIHASLVREARQHSRTVMVGRTHGQQALPITYGYKLAVWISELARHLARMRECETRCFVGNITGAVGTMASFGERGREMQALALSKLGLAVPEICGHSSRDRVVEIAFVVTQLSGTLGKIANEIFNLQRHEIGELREPFHHGKVGSSTMPHKQNPASVELAIGLSRLIRGAMVTITDAMFHEHERDAACLRMELAAVPEIAMYTAGLTRRMRGVVDAMEARPDRMLTNANLLGGLLLSERVMLSLGEFIGKQTAHEIVYEVAMHAQEQGIDFRTALSSDARVSAHLTPEQIDTLLDVSRYIGLAPDIVEELYLAIFSRYPRDKEREYAINLIDSAENRRLAIEDLMWALMNAPEFTIQN